MDIPHYPCFRGIRLEDKPIFQDYFTRIPLNISEYTFTNLFIWHDYYHLQWCLWNESLCMLTQPEGKEPFFLPPVCEDNIIERLDAMLRHLERQHGKAAIQRVPEAFVNHHLKNSNRFKIRLDRGNCDYIYRTEDLIKLDGNKFHGKRNHINKFKKNHSYEYKSLTTSLASECFKMEAEWCNLKHCEIVPGLAGEMKAIDKALRNFDSLPFRGGLIFINGKVEAFALGEQLDQETAVIHVEKANPAFDGLYQLINQEFCQHEWAHTTYINREQDLGEEGLRKAKLSYHPHHLLNKYTVSLRKPYEQANENEMDQRFA